MIWGHAPYHLYMLAAYLLDRAGGSSDGVWIDRRHGRADAGQRTSRGVDGVGRDVVGIAICHVCELAGGVGGDE